MKYINQKSVKNKLHEHGKQITKDGLHAIDIKVEEYLDRLAKLHNGGHSRINATIVKLVN